MSMKTIFNFSAGKINLSLQKLINFLMRKLGSFGITALSIAVFLSYSGCKKTVPEDYPSKTMDDLKVAATFNWQTTREVNFEIGANIESMTGGLLARISVFSGMPEDGGTLLATGSAGYEYPFRTKLRIATMLQEIFLMVQTSTGYQQIVSVPVADNITYTFSSGKGMKLLPGAVTDPDCNTGCTSEASGSGSINISQGKVFCVTTSFSGNVFFQPWNGGGTLKICGTATPSGISNFGNNCQIIVTAGGTFNPEIILSMEGSSSVSVYTGSHFHVKGVNMNSTSSSITNYADDFTLTSYLNSGGDINNYGSMTIGGKYSIWGSATLENSGTLNIGGEFEVGNDIVNSGSITSTQKMSFNSGSVIVNNCKFVSQNNIEFNSTTLTMNNGYIKAEGRTSINGNSSLIMQNQSMISTHEYEQNTNITGQGSLNTIKISYQGAINASHTVSGPIEMSTPSGTLTNGGPSLFINGATLVSTANAVNYIPTSACNPEGTGSQPVTDTDGDGVPNNLDDYPIDPTRAYNTWYPSNSAFGSIGFEDLWPAKGDYDMNDLVVDYQYKIVSNAQNNLVDIIPKFYVRAVGASFQNGFGFQLDNILPVQVETVTGYSLQYGYITLNANGTEANQSNAVIIVFDNAENVIHRAATGSFYNTMRDTPKGYGDTVYINLHFSNPIAPALAGTPPYNVFLIKNLTREIEVHMPNYIPTSLVNPIYFNTEDDTSDPTMGRYYKSSTNLPWAINTPIKFDYTYEKVPVIDGYNHFAAWAESSGTSYPDWYMNTAGYRVVDNIYE